VLLIDLRKTCRRAAAGGRCRAFDNPARTAQLIMMTALEILIAVRLYNIRICSIVSFAAPWEHAWSDLEALLSDHEPSLLSLPRYHIGQHLGWFGSVASWTTVRQKQITATKAFQDLAIGLSKAGVISATPQDIYANLHAKLSDEYYLLPWDTDLSEGTISPRKPPSAALRKILGFVKPVTQDSDFGRATSEPEPVNVEPEPVNIEPEPANVAPKRMAPNRKPRFVLPTDPVEAEAVRQSLRGRVAECVPTKLLPPTPKMPPKIRKSPIKRQPPTSEAAKQALAGRTKDYVTPVSEFARPAVSWWKAEPQAEPQSRKRPAP